MYNRLTRTIDNLNKINESIEVVNELVKLKEDYRSSQDFADEYDDIYIAIDNKNVASKFADKLDKLEDILDRSSNNPSTDKVAQIYDGLNSQDKQEANTIITDIKSKLYLE